MRISTTIVAAALATAAILFSAGAAAADPRPGDTGVDSTNTEVNNPGWNSFSAFGPMVFD